MILFGMSSIVNVLYCINLHSISIHKERIRHQSSTFRNTVLLYAAQSSPGDIETWSMYDLNGRLEISL